MALTRKMLKAMGIEEEKIDQIIDAHTETVDALKADRDKFKKDAETLPTVQRELDELKAAAGKDGKNPFEVKYNAIKEEFENYKNEQTAKETKAAKSAAYKALLKDAGIAEKRIDAVLRVSDIDSIELDKDGKIKDADKLTASVKTEWSDFITASGTKGAETKTPPVGGDGGKKYTSKQEIMAIKNTAERQQAIHDNHELFGY